MPNETETFDVIIIGGGPAGATGALCLARRGIRVVVLEKAQFPRFHLGESILPQNFPLVQELGLEPALKRLPHLTKYGAEFIMGDDLGSAIEFTFDQGLIPGSVTFNIERALFDEMLLNEAAAAGAVVRQQTAVTSITLLEENNVQVIAGGKTINGCCILDGSGHGTVVARHLGTRRTFDDEALQKVAYYQHFENVERLPGTATGHPTIVMCEEGWFWIIGLNETKTSVGFVTRPSFARTIEVPPNRLLDWAIQRCPVVKHRMRNAIGLKTNDVIADFSYRCRPAAGPGYFLLGDAAMFLDPIFSTGVTLAMKGAVQAVNQVAAMLLENKSPAVCRSRYVRYIEGSTAIFWKLIRNYYQHSFRELFLNGTGPLQVHKAVIAILAGNVFPKPQWKLRWRLWLFYVCMHLNKWLPLVPRRKRFSLLASDVASHEPLVTAQSA